MFITNTINKQVFDFTCSSETIATQMQNEIVYNTTPVVDNIIDEILTGEFDKDEHLIIDKIEIDLGDIAIKDFGSVDMLDYFKRALKEKITSFRNKQDSFENDRILSFSEAELDMTIAFLLSGNFPWWADKTKPVDLDEMLKKLIKEKPEAIKSFLLKYSSAGSVVNRLAKQYKPSTRSAVDILLPGLIDKFYNKRAFTEAEYEIHFKEFPPKILEKFSSIVRKKNVRSHKEYKSLHLITLLKQPYYKWVKALQILNILPADELEKLQLFYSSKNKKKRKEAISILKKLSVFQVEFLLLSTFNSNNIEPAEYENKIAEGGTAENESFNDAGVYASNDTYFSNENVNTIIAKTTIVKDELLHLKNVVDNNSIKNSYDSEYSNTNRSSDNNKKPLNQNNKILNDNSINGFSALKNKEENRTNGIKDLQYSVSSSDNNKSQSDQNSRIFNADFVNEFSNLRNKEENSSDSIKNAQDNVYGDTNRLSENSKSQPNQDNRILNDSVDNFSILKNKEANSSDGIKNSYESGYPDINRSSENNRSLQSQNISILKDNAADQFSTSKKEQENNNHIKNSEDNVHLHLGNSAFNNKSQLNQNNLFLKETFVNKSSTSNNKKRNEIKSHPENKASKSNENSDPNSFLKPSIYEDKNVSNALDKTPDNSYENIVQHGIDKSKSALNSAETFEPFKKDFLAEEEPGNKVTPQSVPGKKENIEVDYRNSETSENYGDVHDKELLANKKPEIKDHNQTADNYDYKRKSRIDYIRNKLSKSNEALYNELSLLSDQDLLMLETQFKQFEDVLHKRKKILNDIIEHSYLFKYDLFEILAGSSFIIPGDVVIGAEPVKKNKIKKPLLSLLFTSILSSQSGFVNTINNLSATEAVVFQDVFKKKSYETENEKRIVKKVFKKLPEESVRLLHFFTKLHEDEMKEFLSLCKKNRSARSQEKLNQPPFTHYTNQQQKVYIENAGLCIVATYFPALFRHLQYLENGIFKNKAIAGRALYLIQYITTGQLKSPEYLLQFNKLLCGFQVEENIPANIRLTKKERMEADDLIKSVIENWETIKNTSLNGFRESFLQRKGILSENELSWTLQVERKSYDMLLSSIPWGFGLIKLPWMRKHVQVEW